MVSMVVYSNPSLTLLFFYIGTMAFHNMRVARFFGVGGSWVLENSVRMVERLHDVLQGGCYLLGKGLLTIEVE